MSDRIYYSNEAKNKARNERAMIAIVFTALGLSIGAALSLLFAPMQGDEMRDELVQKASMARDNIEDYSEQAKKAISK